MMRRGCGLGLPILSRANCLNLLFRDIIIVLYYPEELFNNVEFTYDETGLWVRVTNLISS